MFIVACSNDHGGKHLQISGRVVLETESMEIIPVDDTIHGDVLYHTFVPSIFGGVYCKNYIDFVTDENGFFSIDIPMASTENVYISDERMIESDIDEFKNNLINSLIIFNRKKIIT